MQFGLFFGGFTGGGTEFFAGVGTVCDAVVFVGAVAAEGVADSVVDMGGGDIGRDMACVCTVELSAGTRRGS